MASIDITLSGEITKWLVNLGYPAASLTTPMEAHIKRWGQYLTHEAKYFSREIFRHDGTRTTVRVRTCSPADMVDEDMASLIYNERAEISVPDDETANEWLQEWLRSVSWANRAPLAIKRMCDYGTAGWALHVSGVQTFGKSDVLTTTPQRYDARFILPLSWDADNCTDCAFLAQVWVKGEKLTQVEVHRPQYNGDYEIMCAFFDSSGHRIVPEGFLDADKSINTKQPNPTFSLIRLAADNPYWDYSPMGVALFDGKEDTLETVDLAFDALGNEIVLGRKMLAMPEALMRRSTDGDLILPQTEDQQFFLATGDTVYGEGLGIYEYNPSLRSAEDREMLSTALQILGKRMGFGTKYYSLDANGSITTAKQVASDNAELMRTVRRHEHVIIPAVASLMAAAAGIHTKLGRGVKLPDLSGAVQVVLGDSIIQDDDALRERDRADVAAGLMERWRYMVKWHGLSEEDAKAFTGETDSFASVPVE